MPFGKKFPFLLACFFAQAGLGAISMIGYFIALGLEGLKKERVFGKQVNFAYNKEKNMEFRTEKDTMGEVKVPGDAFSITICSGP